MEAIFGPLLLLAICLALCAPVVAYLKHAERKRRKLLAGYAARREWSFHASDPSLVDRYEEAPFGRGHNRRATNVLRGRFEGRPTVVFDYRYSSSRSEGGGGGQYLVVSIHLGVFVPSLSVAPAGAMSRLINRLTKTDIEVGHASFDEAFTVRSYSPAFAREVLHADLAQMMLSWPDLAWRFERDSMLAVMQGTETPERIDNTLQAMDTVLRAVPQQVWDRLTTTEPDDDEGSLFRLEP